MVEDAIFFNYNVNKMELLTTFCEFRYLLEFNFKYLRYFKRGSIQSYMSVDVNTCWISIQTGTAVMHTLTN
jgi:hypothetical protein